MKKLLHIESNNMRMIKHFECLRTRRRSRQRSLKSEIRSCIFAKLTKQLYVWQNRAYRFTGLDLDPATSDRSGIAGRSDADVLAQVPLCSNVQNRIPNEEQRGLELTKLVLREILVDHK